MRELNRSADAFPRFFAETCARRAKRVEKFQLAGEKKVLHDTRFQCLSLVETSSLYCSKGWIWLEGFIAVFSEFFFYFSSFCSYSSSFCSSFSPFLLVPLVLLFFHFLVFLLSPILIVNFRSLLPFQLFNTTCRRDQFQEQYPL